jgi:putative flippase GtrA
MLTDQIQRFLIVGFTTVALDFVAYRILLYLDSPLAVAKGLGFIAGTIFAYFANKLWTFNRAEGGRKVFGMFVGLYVTTLFINVGVNGLIIAISEERELFLALAFLVATGTSATINFIGMRMIVFKSKQQVIR